MILTPHLGIRLRIPLSLNLLFLFILSTQSGWATGIELHAHLFMKHGMTWLFRGDFHEPLQAKDWSSRLSSQANAESLERSQLDLIVATLYAHPFLTSSLRDSIRSQIQELKIFLKESPNWVLAKTPFEAQSALASGKKVLILALEGGSGILETEEDLKEWVDQEGIRIVTFLHLTDDHWGGVAFLKGYQALASPWAFILNLFHPHLQTLEDGSKIKVNARALTPVGREKIKELLKHHVWIDFTHASDASQEEIKKLLPSKDYPILYTHTVLRRFFKAERGISDEQLSEVVRTRGYLGLMPSEEMLKGTPSLFSRPECQGGIFALAQQYQLSTSLLGESSVAMGSDYNGGITHLKPLKDCPSLQTSLNTNGKGLWEIGQSIEIWKALQALGVWHPQASEVLKDHSHAQTFIQTWERAWRIMSELNSKGMTKK